MVNFKLKQMSRKIITIFSFFVLLSFNLQAEDGHDLWLRGKGTNSVNVICSKKSPTLSIAMQELRQGWQGKTNEKIELVVKSDKAIKGDGFRIGKNRIQANTDIGILYGVYELMRRQQTGENIYEEVCNPSYERRILNHWDNLDGTIERGYAGSSIFWRKGKDSLTVTDTDKQLWQEYARANASIGINGSVLNNVNASPAILTADYLKKTKEIADVLRPYGIRTYLSVNFASPQVIGGLKTSDPLNSEVAQWWKNKVKEIYSLIPDFGGFLVKANSEGQPGPQDFGRTHADGANMLADALSPFGGMVMWRAFVYNPSDEDRAKQAYSEFMPLDGQFRDNVIIQVKNGPIDFQPREPFSPLFGAMKKTSVMPELQITQEYLGQSVHLVYLATMWEEFLKSDTYQEGKGSTVARCTDGSLFPQKHTAIAGVSNIGSDVNWCGHPFAQSNWYAFGRLAWNNSLSSEQIADEWIKLTFADYSGKIDTQNSIFSADWQVNFLQPVKQMMLNSREAAINYMMPLGLHHLFAADHHYGPGPWWAPTGVRKDWTPPYYHKADSIGIGFDRTATGSNAVSQYQEPLQSMFSNSQTCPDIYLLWFHHLPWNFIMKDGQTLWAELCYRYDKGVRLVREFQKTWDQVQRYVDAERFSQVQTKLREQCMNAQVWKDACLLYFRQFSKMPFPNDMERPVNNLEDLIKKDEQSRKIK
jgi:alpha-glucuronidase